MTDPKKGHIIVYRPHGRYQDCAGIAYDEEGITLATHVSSSLDWFRQDMGLDHKRSMRKHDIYAERYPQGYELEEVIGNWEDHPIMGQWPKELQDG